MKDPSKTRDRESFTVPLDISSFHFDKALCNLGTSINLIALLLCGKLGIGEIKPSIICLQLTVHFHNREGVLKDVRVKLVVIF